VVTPVRRRGVDRHEAILAAARRCFAERGVRGTGIEDVRRAAGASPSSLYHLFGGLEDIVAQLLTRTFEDLFARLGAASAAAPSAERAVEALVRGHVRWVLEEPDAARFMYEATSLRFTGAAADAVAAGKAAAIGPVVAALQPFVRSGELPAWPIAQLEIVVMGPAHEACRRVLAGAALPTAWLVDELPRIAWRSLRAADS
jgi:AcrR family transcriptional regulator